MSGLAPGIRFWICTWTVPGTPRPKAPPTALPSSAVKPAPTCSCLNHSFRPNCTVFARFIHVRTRRCRPRQRYGLPSGKTKDPLLKANLLEDFLQHICMNLAKIEQIEAIRSPTRIPPSACSARQPESRHRRRTLLEAAPMASRHPASPAPRGRTKRGATALACHPLLPNPNPARADGKTPQIGQAT